MHTSEASLHPSLKMEPRALIEGGTAYIRVKEFTSGSQKGWVPQGGEAKLAFGDPVTLVKKKDKDSPNNPFWLVSTSAGAQEWIPAYLLTSSQVEINSLRDKGRIPQTMSFFYEGSAGEAIRLAGAADFFSFETTSDGVPASNQGSDQVAIEGNGVVFDQSAAKHDWKMPMIFSDGKRVWKIDANLMWYCTKVDKSQGSGCGGSSGSVTLDCSAGQGARPKGSFDCVEVAGESASNSR